ncbi:MAG: transcription antitermination factor NusB [Flavobacteriaceae bacterium]
MQSIYAMHQSNSDAIEKEEKFLFLSIENIQNLYLTVLSALVEIREYESDFIEKSKNKHLKTKEEMNPNMKFVSNAILNILSESSSLSEALEAKKINNWKLNDDYIIILANAVKSSEIYKNYMAVPSQDFESDKQFILDIFAEIIAPNDKFYEYLEDYKITWVDDIPTVNTNIIKQISRLKSENDTFKISKLYKDDDDKEFVKQLFRKTILNESELEKEYADKTPNWDKDRIAELDTIILKMAICEFLKFPSIPFKVTINEYLEIAKEYSTPKSSIFINGILDNLSKKYQSENRNLKAGRGLM